MFFRANFFRLVLFLASCLILSLVYFYLKTRPPYTLYSQLDSQELHDSEQLVRSEEKKKYVLFRQLRGAGFNNQVSHNQVRNLRRDDLLQVQDILLYHNLALATSRTYVYQPFVWRPRGEKSYVPLSAFLVGVTKSSINLEVFHRICPEKDIAHLSLGIGSEIQWQHALEMLASDEQCVMVDDWIFNWTFLTDPGLHSVWPSFQKYLQIHFEWSPAIINLIHRAQNQLNLRKSPSSTTGEAYLALHLRRGDFESHCKYLSEVRVGLTTWATLPNLQSSILSPPPDTTNATSVLMHCYPSLDRILSCISLQAQLHPNARTLYILHDGAIGHPGVYLQLYKLREALMSEEWAEKNHWSGGPITRVLQSSDVDRMRTWGENDYGVAVDVELGRRAEGFIGNGYSSLSTHIIALRLAEGGKAEDITFI